MLDFDEGLLSAMIPVLEGEHITQVRRAGKKEKLI